MNALLILCGPTAVGKTDVAIALARHCSGEIIVADSQQVYRGLDIGTAKPSASQRREVPHHLIDVIDPQQSFDAATFVTLADQTIAALHARGKLPIVVGGTGMYLKMLVHGICPLPGRNPDLRRQLEEEMHARGLAALHAELGEIDPHAAAAIRVADRTRIVRALELWRLTGKKPSALWGEHGFREQRYPVLTIGLDRARAELYQRIDRRVDAMLAAGWLDEVKELVARFGRDSRAFRAVGYRELIQHLAGDHALDETIRLIKLNSRHFAKRQLTWFRRDKTIRWFHPDATTAITRCIDSFKAAV